MLTGFVTPVVLAGVLLAFARLNDGAWEPGAQVAGICRELLAGTTQGRQALFGSCWTAPLPVLVYLPFAWLLSEPLAGWVAFFVAWLFAFWAVREAVKATGQSGWRIVLAQAAIAAMMIVARQPQALQFTTPLTMGLVLLTAASLADWWAGRPATMAALTALIAEGKPVIAAAGVSQPERFFGMLRAAGLDIAPLPLPDHHAYATLPWPSDAPHVVVTEKDAVKLRPEQFAAGPASTRVWVAPLDFCGDASFDTALMALLH